jgi:hypothetical protein
VEELSQLGNADFDDGRLRREEISSRRHGRYLRAISVIAATSVSSSFG